VNNFIFVSFIRAEGPEERSDEGLRGHESNVSLKVMLTTIAFAIPSFDGFGVWTIPSPFL